LDIILEARPEIFNHNIETVRELTPRVRHKATYDRTLNMLAYAKSHRKSSHMMVKSVLWLDWGDPEQVKETIRDLKDAGCDIITIGQYLQANHRKLRVKSFVHPEQFKCFEEYGHAWV